jgi:uncharacterized protein YbjT (DUF2867 family)
MKIILTGATGLVGEGVLIECLANPLIEKVLSVGRRLSGHSHAKLEELLVPDFLQLDAVESKLSGYDACFYCAGITSRGMSEADYTRVTYDTPLHFAKVLARLNPQMVFDHISGQSTDSSEQGRVMWARVKGRAENALMKLPFKAVYNFRPGLMTPMPGQKKGAALRILSPLLGVFFTGLTMQEVAWAMINATRLGSEKKVLEAKDMKALAALR